MKYPTTFQPLTAPLHGINLIEASAGTGKTWNIAALFTRLVLLEQADISQILVVTFTKAATAELTTRLRARLDNALHILRDTPNAAQHIPTLQQQCGKDEFLFELLKQALQQESQSRLQLRLQAAVSSFDNAAIYTIHGFCQRVLQDFAFLCQVPFDIELDEHHDQAQRLIAAQDFWRSEIANHSIWAELAYRLHLTPQKTLAELNQFISRPYLHYPNDETAEQNHINAQNRWKEIWAHINHPNTLDNIEQTFWHIHPKLNGNSFRKTIFEQKFIQLKEYLGQTPAPNKLLSILRNSKGDLPFTADFIHEKSKKNAIISDDAVQIIAILGELGQACADAEVAEQHAVAHLGHRLLTHLKAHREQYKKHHPQRVFDDLLADVSLALQTHSVHANALAHALSTNWRFALIDEFQDTDPLQYGIFHAAFAQSGTPLFLVGDPKQAIYSFRGADIFAYLQAAEDAAQQRYTLTQNHRSHSTLINSISALFQHHPSPFVLPKISYPTVQARRHENRLYEIDTDPKNAVYVRWLHAIHSPETETAAILEQRAAQWCAEEIAGLLQRAAQQQCMLQRENNTTTPLQANDVAVLVRRRKDGERVRRELRRHGIQSVLLSQNNIFAEPEAEAIAALLDFIIHPQHIGVLRFVLAGCLFEQTADELLTLNQDETHLSAWTESADAALATWQQSGIYAALQQFLNRHNVETRLLSQRNERSLTNLHQIMELLAIEDELSHSPTSLQQWLEQKITDAHNGTISTQENTLRLESDDDLVKIVTIHAAKGLQYPIVFCPFAWKAANNNSKAWHIVHTDHHTELVHDSTLTETARQQLENETLSEDLRLLYVALTRAEERLYLYTAAYRDGGKSALAYLLNAQDIASKPTEYAQLWQQFITQHPSDGFVWLTTPPTAVSPLHTTEAQHTPYQAHHFQERHYRFTTHTSFTRLSRQTKRASEAVHAELLPTLAPEELLTPPQSTERTETTTNETTDPPTIHQFPQGAAAGICLHALLEHYPFHSDAHEYSEETETILTRHGFDATIWLEPVAQMLNNVRHTPLTPHICLANIPPNEYRTEMEFLLHTNNFKPQDIQQWLAQPHLGLSTDIINTSQSLHFQHINGFISGAIDLICCDTDGTPIIIDYKSNHLGTTTTDYTPAALNQSVAQHHYYLQALIYAIATARHFNTHNALTEHIGIRYLFLRGLDGTTHNGIWSWDIPINDLIHWL